MSIIMTIGSVYGTQPLGKYLKKLGVFVILAILSSILVVIIPLELLKWLRRYIGQEAVVDITVEQIVVVSLDLGTETYNQYRLPQGFDEVPPSEPTVGVLGDCLCFSYWYKETDFIIWQMKEFGVEESWTQFLKISYHDLQLNQDFSDDTLKYNFRFLPLFLSNDGDTLLLDNIQEEEAIIYNWRDHRVERTGVSVHKTSIDDGNAGFLCWYFAKGFVESLISIC